MHELADFIVLVLACVLGGLYIANALGMFRD